MSKSKRRRRPKQRRKAKLRKRIRKIQRKRNREVQHSEYLGMFQPFIDDEYQRGSKTLYRWTHHPITEDDFLPQVFQSFSDIDIDGIDVPSPSGSKKRIASYVEKFTLSHFETEQQAIGRYNEVISNLKNSDHPERAEGFKESKGSYLTKCNYSEDDILFGQPDEHGHINVLLCKGFDARRVVDTTYTLKIV